MSRGQHTDRQRTGAGAQFQHITAGELQDLRTLSRHAATKQAGQLRRRDKIPAAAELDAAGTVVAQPRRIQDDAQIVVERQPATMGGNRLAHRLQHGGSVARLIRLQRRQD